jgi:hypothetical protein
LSVADQHIQLIKAAIRRTFPNLDSAVEASHLQINYLVGVNQAVQTQFTNLRDGTATARNANTANTALSANFANGARFARSAAVLVQPTTAYGIKQADESFAFPGDQVDVAVVTVSQSGLYTFRGLIVADLGAMTANAIVLFDLDGFATSDSGRWAVGDQPAFNSNPVNASASLRARLPLRVASGPVVAAAEYGPQTALIPVHGRLSLDGSASRNITLRLTTFSGLSQSIKRGSYAGVRRLGNAVEQI